MIRVDTFLFNGEWIVKKRLAYLYPVIDWFVIVESYWTHAGDRKPKLYKDIYADWFEPFASKITWIVLEEFPPMTDEWRAQCGSYAYIKNNYEAWFRESYQRNVAGTHIARVLKGQTALVGVGDVDEFPRKELLEPESSARILQWVCEKQQPIYMEMDFYYYNLNWKKPVQWYNAYWITPALLETAGKTLNDWRNGHPPVYIIPNAGWHLSYFMSPLELQRKLRSFAHRECDTEHWSSLEHIRGCLLNGKDLFGRDAEDLKRASFDMLPACFQEWQAELEEIQGFKGI